MPQSNEPDGLATAHVRKVVMTLPQGHVGLAVLGGRAGSVLAGADRAGHQRRPDAARTRPSSARCTIDTPLLPDPLTGDVILATQNDNPFRSLVALYIVVKGPGFYVKLPGKIDLDPATGQLTATFENTPQVPFSRDAGRLPRRLAGGAGDADGLWRVQHARRDHLVGLGYAGGAGLADADRPGL